jgi:hypothetical protein
MSNYIPWYGKKRERLARRENDLHRVLLRVGSEEEVTRAAEEVRAARIRVLKAERARVRPCGGPHATRFQEVDDAIRECLATPVDAIIAEYRRKRRV